MADLLRSARRAVKEYRLRQDSTDPRLVNVPHAAQLDLHRMAASSTSAAVSQLIPFEPEVWDPEAFEHTIWREVARDGRSVKRLYVLPHRGISQETVSRQLELDSRAGVEAHIVHLSDIPEGSRAEVPSGLWIVDEETLITCHVPSGPATEPVWTISQRPEDLEQGAVVWRQLFEWSAGNADGNAAAVDLEEPLVLSADLMHGVAAVMCSGDHIDRSSCAWYHGAWQYMRVMNLVSTPTWHSEFYTRELSAAISRRESVRAIITGTADYSLLAYLLACDPDGRAEVDVLDLCATPLFACRWYAKRQRRRIGMLEADLMGLNGCDGRYDLLCSDAFLTRFSGEEVRNVLAKWSELLKPGGRVVTTVRMHPLSPPVREPMEAVRDFRERAEQRLQRWRPFLGRSAAEVGQLVEVYAERMRSADVGDVADVRELFNAAGLPVCCEEVAEVPGELQPTTYLRLVCEKRD